jgi:hypothetical protein
MPSSRGCLSGLLLNAPLVSQATPSQKEGLVLCNSAVCSGSHDNYWGVLIDRSALCAIDIHSTVGHVLHLVRTNRYIAKYQTLFPRGCGLRD